MPDGLGRELEAGAADLLLAKKGFNGSSRMRQSQAIYSRAERIEETDERAKRPAIDDLQIGVDATKTELSYKILHLGVVVEGAGTVVNRLMLLGHVGLQDGVEKGVSGVCAAEPGIELKCYHRDIVITDNAFGERSERIVDKCTPKFEGAARTTEAFLAKGLVGFRGAALIAGKGSGIAGVGMFG